MLWTHSTRLARLLVLDLIDFSIGQRTVEQFEIRTLCMCILAWRDVGHCHCNNMIGSAFMMTASGKKGNRCTFPCSLTSLATVVVEAKYLDVLFASTYSSGFVLGL